MRTKYLIISIACFVVASVCFLLMGCAASPVRVDHTVYFDLPAVRVYCASDAEIKNQWLLQGGSKSINGVIAFAHRDSRTIWVQCVEINGRIFPSSLLVLGHEYWHHVNYHNRRETICPDEEIVKGWTN